MKRGPQGALWSLPIAFALSLGIGGNIELALWSTAGFAALSLVRMFWLRAPARVFLYLGTLYLAAQSRRGLLYLPAHTFAVLRAHHVTSLAPAQAMLLFVALVPLLVLAFELGGRSVHLRLWQALGGVLILAVVQNYGTSVAAELVVFAALYFPVRYFDLALESAHGRMSVVGAATAFTLAAVAVFLVNPIVLPGVVYGKGGVETQGYLVNPQDINVAVRPSASREFFASVAQPVYWTAYVGEQYTGQGWKLSGRWRTMRPLQLTGAVPADARVLKERIRLYANLPTDPVGGALLTVLAPAHRWRYRPLSSAYAAPSGTFTVLAAVPKAGGGIVGPSNPPPTAADLAVPEYLATGEVASIAAQAVAGAGQSTLAKAQAIIAYLHANERYTLSVPSDGGIDFVSFFLTSSHAGDCNGFSSAFAILARDSGIPTRWVTGFLPGRRVKGGYLVTAKDAHSWDEIYVSGSGWVAIDPTPGFAVPQIQPRLATTSPSLSVQSAISSARLAQRQLDASVKTGRGATAPRGTPFWAFAAAAVVALAIGFVIVRRALPLWWLRAVAFAFRDPWRRTDTVRQWLHGRAPMLEAYVEWRTYRPPVPCPVTPIDALSDFSRLYLGRRG